MSKVFSFRLDADNPREAQAIEAIDTWVSKRYSLRYILAEALINGRNNQNNSQKLSEYIDRLTALVQEIDNGRGSNERRDEITKLPMAFTDAMKKSAKRGMRSNTYVGTESA